MKYYISIIFALAALTFSSCKESEPDPFYSDNEQTMTVMKL